MLGREAKGSLSSDPVNYCGIAMWWGRCELSSELSDLLKPTQTNKTGATFWWFMGDGSSPGNFVGAPVDNGSAFLWSAAQHCEVEPEKSADLTVRGGVRGSSVKAELERILSEQKRCALIRGIVAATPAGSVTKVGLYDRKILDHKMVSRGGRVVILGDAAHPQTPFLGQGCNMALADAFAVCTRLGYAYGSSLQKDECDDGVRRALACVEDAERKKFVKKTITDARWIASLSVSDSMIGNFFTRQVFRLAPESFIFPRVDEGNRDFVNKALKDCGLPQL
jgi:2-polyprenyl-6-methoxyphenol hydroxylase-like FAD-dependent oxidoreductase